MSAEPLLSTKLQIPPARAGLVARPRLLARLDAGLAAGRRLTLVCAPAGFGKTTLIRAWTAARARPVAWLSLDEDDNDPGRILRYLLAALGPAGEGPDPAAGAPRDLVVALINHLAAGAAPVTLVLDDYHLIRTFAVHDAIAFLIEHQPPNLHLVIGTREDPPLPLARLRARDQVTEMREAALRFRSDEATAFFSETMKLDIAAGTLAGLMARTEGWITGLQLAGLAIGEQNAGDAFVAAFARDDRYILDYLMAEVLGRQPEAVASFLRRTSILERLSAPLCAAILGNQPAGTGAERAQALLDQIEAANLFLFPLDGRREWFRYQVIFAEALRLTLPPEEQVELHDRAAAWLRAHGLAGQAQHHARRLAELQAEARPRGGTLPPAAAQPLVEPLSERELEVLRLIAQGHANAEIGRRLFITLGTVKRHTNNIYGKLGAASRTQAVARARNLGLLD